MLGKTLSVLFGLFLIFAGILGMILLSLTIWFGITDPDEMDLFVRIIAVGLLLWWDLQSFAVIVIGCKCIVGFRNKRTKAFVPAPQNGASRKILRCPDCGANLRVEAGKRMKCIYCGKKFAVDL